ncbi:MAG: hypothetical protein H7X91_07880 [Burkholderiales bacterium]|nr:hypothetical protein [Burkholderiales bacterium]
MPFHYRALTAEEETQISGSQEAKIRENVIARTVARLHEHPTIVGRAAARECAHGAQAQRSR